MTCTSRQDVRAIDLPCGSTLRDFIGPNDFVDCYAAPARIAPRRTAEIIVYFPPWAKALLRLRPLMTAPFGLSNDGPDAPDKLGPLPVERETEDVIIAGSDNKHLNFRVAVTNHDEQVSHATWVRPKNFAGRAYLAAIITFHIIIVRDAVARVAKVAA